MKRPPRVTDYNMSDIEITEVSSTTECTGIVPSAPESEEGLNNRLELMSFSPECVDEFMTDNE